MKIVEKETTPLEMIFLIRKGVLLEFQTFFDEAGGRKQVYRTKAASRGVVYVCYHHRPLPFMTSQKGRVIPDENRKRYLDSFD